MGTIQIDGSTPKLTIGNATAEDALILFDGNAQDYHVGLDDSSDSLVIGLGSTLGTTPAMTVNSSQVVTFAQNPVFPDGGVAVADLDIDGATDIGANIVDADLFIIDDGAGGTNRKVTASRIKTYAGGAVTAINNATANELVTIGSTTTELDAESGLTYTDGALVIGGTTPSLTIGDAGAEDTKLVFDGNAQDFHIGLDDSSDKLVIGLGSTLGTTTHMSFDSTGAILQPLQPAFVVSPSSNSADIAADTTHTITADTEILDRNGDWDGTNTFTAPTTGMYMLSGTVGVYDFDHDNNYSALFVLTSNRRWTPMFSSNNSFGVDGTYFFHFGLAVDMDASDTAVFQFRNDQGSQQPWIAQEYTFFSGYLLG